MLDTTNNNTYLLNISKLAMSRLSRFSSIAEANISHSFLFASDEFCGMRFIAGKFTAKWLFGQDAIEIARGGQVIDHVLVDDSSARQAA